MHTGERGLVSYAKIKGRKIALHSHAHSHIIRTNGSSADIPSKAKNFLFNLNIGIANAFAAKSLHEI